jgi:hypothetical protein
LQPIHNLTCAPPPASCCQLPASSIARLIKLSGRHAQRPLSLSSRSLSLCSVAPRASVAFTHRWHASASAARGAVKYACRALAVCRRRLPLPHQHPTPTPSARTTLFASYQTKSKSILLDLDKVWHRFGFGLTAHLGLLDGGKACAPVLARTRTSPLSPLPRPACRPFGLSLMPSLSGAQGAQGLTQARALAHRSSSVLLVLRLAAARGTLSIIQSSATTPIGNGNGSTDCGLLGQRALQDLRGPKAFSITISPTAPLD